jgi:hypothetical protein
MRLNWTTAVRPPRRRHQITMQNDKTGRRPYRERRWHHGKVSYSRCPPCQEGRHHILILDEYSYVAIEWTSFSCSCSIAKQSLSLFASCCDCYCYNSNSGQNKVGNNKRENDNSPQLSSKFYKESILSLSKDSMPSSMGQFYIIFVLYCITKKWDNQNYKMVYGMYAMSLSTWRTKL